MNSKIYVTNDMPRFEIHVPKNYRIDFNKVKSLEDMKKILELLVFGFKVTVSENYENIDEIKEFLVEV